ncbi:MAG: hypothetical protein CL433_06435, partial [Acidimicrobiaceae bacterium]|nr:hypothetical protein [Acidimicrobiaceae bacterium]
MTSGDFFSAETHPQMAFVSTRRPRTAASV